MDLSLFDIKEEKQQDKVVKSIKQNKAWGKHQKFYLKHQEIIKNIGEITEFPENDGEMVNILSNNQFNAFTFIPFILSKRKIKSLSIATYSINQKIIDAVLELYINKQVKELNFFVSLHFLRTRGYIAKSMIEAHEKYKDINVGFAFSHAKITIMDNFVVVGSGNMTKNTRVEQYILANSKEMADFFRDNFFENFELNENLRKLAYE